LGSERIFDVNSKIWLKKEECPRPSEIIGERKGNLREREGSQKEKDQVAKEHQVVEVEEGDIKED